MGSFWSHFWNRFVGTLLGGFLGVWGLLGALFGTLLAPLGLISGPFWVPFWLSWAQFRESFLFVFVDLVFGTVLQRIGAHCGAVLGPGRVWKRDSISEVVGGRFETVLGSKMEHGNFLG